MKTCFGNFPGGSNGPGIWIPGYGWDGKARVMDLNLPQSDVCFARLPKLSWYQWGCRN